MLGLWIVVSACNDAWTDSVAMLHVDAASLVNKHAQNVINDLTKLSSLSQVCLFDCLLVLLSLCLVLCLSLCLSLLLHLSVRPSVCLSVCLSVSLSVCPSVCLSVR